MYINTMMDSTIEQNPACPRFWNSGNPYECVIDLSSPTSTAPSTPMSEAPDFDVPLDEPTTSRRDTPMVLDFSPPTVVQTMVSTILFAQRHNQPKEQIIAVINHLTTHLYNNSVTLNDVESLIPALNHVHIVTSRVATNIGLNSGLGKISGLEVEKMLEHILINGDTNNMVFERTKDKLGRFRVMDWGRPAERVKPAAEDRGFPLLQKSKAPNPQLAISPIACPPAAKAVTDIKTKSWADTIAPTVFPPPAHAIAEFKAKTWADIVRPSKPTQPFNLTLRPKPQPQPQRQTETRLSSRSSSTDSTCNNFARTRLHNGPGLTDKRRPKIRLPQNDTRKVYIAIGDVASVAPGPDARHKRVEEKYVWMRTKPSSDFLFGKKKSKEIVVKLPLPSLN